MNKYITHKLKKYIKVGLIALSALSHSTSFTSERNSEDKLNTLKTKIEAIQNKHNIPAIAIAVIKPNEPWTIETFGYADKEQQKPVTADHYFRYASISKMIPAIAILQLQEQGKLKLTDNLRDLTPSIRFSNPWQQSNPIKVQHLLEHTTGWGTDLKEQTAQYSDNNSVQDTLNITAGNRVSRWVPGTRQAYNNTGPVVAARVVELLTALPFDEYAKKHIFYPLGMNNTGFLKSDDWQKMGVKLYQNDKAIDYRYFPTRHSSALNSPISDMTKLLNLFINPHQSEVLSSESIKRMQKAVSHLAGKHDLTTHYGFAHQARTIKGHLFYGHSGRFPGLGSNLLYNPETKMGFIHVKSTNNPHGQYELTKTLADYLELESPKIKLKSAQLHTSYQAAEGLYTKQNTTLKLTDFISYFTDAVTVHSGSKELHFQWLFGGYSAKYTQQSNGSILYNDFNQAKVSLAKDPLLGEVLLRDSDVYKKTSKVWFYTQLIAVIISVVVFLCSVLFSIYALLIRPVMSISMSTSSKQALLPIDYLVIAPAVLVTISLFILLGNEVEYIIENVVWVGKVIFALTIVYPLLSITSLLYLFKIPKYVKAIKVYFWYAVTCANCILSLYLLKHGLFAINPL